MRKMNIPANVTFAPSILPMILRGYGPKSTVTPIISGDSMHERLLQSLAYPRRTAVQFRPVRLMGEQPMRFFRGRKSGNANSRQFLDVVTVTLQLTPASAGGKLQRNHSASSSSSSSSRPPTPMLGPVMFATKKRI